MKYVAFTVVALLITGCANENKITLQNMASGSVYVNFRAKTYTVAPGTSTTIAEVPNGVYDYSTIFEIPANKSIAVEGEAAGTLTLEEKDTKINMVYSSYQKDTLLTYGCTVSSTRSLITSTTTSP